MLTVPDSPSLSTEDGGRFLYQKTASEIRRRILNGTYSPSGRLPSQVQFSKDLGVSQITVRRALAELVNEGLLYSAVGSGTYVTERQSAKVTGSRPCIAWISEEILGGYPLAKEMAVAIREYCHKKHMSLYLVEIPPGQEQIGSADAALPADLSGAILLSPIHVHVLAQLQQSGIPYVMLHNELADARSYCVSCDYAAAAAMAGQHLLEQGCRRLVMVTAEETRYSAGQMSLGFNLLRHLSAAKYDANFEVVHADYTGRQIFSLLERWLKSPQPPDGVICATDQMAEAVVLACRSCGLNVPGNLAVVGFGNTAEAQAADLSSIKAHNDITGLQAMQLLELLMDGQQPAQHRWLIEPELVVRQTSLRPSQATKK